MWNIFKFLENVSHWQKFNVLPASIILNLSQFYKKIVEILWEICSFSLPLLWWKTFIAKVCLVHFPKTASLRAISCKLLLGFLILFCCWAFWKISARFILKIDKNRIFIRMPTKYIYMLVLCSCNSRFEYLWADGTNVKKPIKCSAPKYIDYLMTWVQEQLDDETLFPSKIGELWFYFNKYLFLEGT